jgi:hypothetical protein
LRIGLRVLAVTGRRRLLSIATAVLGILLARATGEHERRQRNECDEQRRTKHVKTSR